MTLTQKELEVNAALQKTGIEKYTEAMREIAALLHVELDLDSSYHGGLNLQVELGKVFATLRAVNNERPEIISRKNIRFSSNMKAFYFKLEGEPMYIVTYESLNSGTITRIGLGRPQFTFPDYWMKNPSDKIVEEIADRLKFLNALRRLIILTQDVQHESKTQDTAESLARASKAMAQLELLRRL